MTMSEQRRADVEFVRLADELDCASLPAALRVITCSIQQAIAFERVVVVDLCDVTFLDSAGITLLLVGQKQASQAGMSFHVRLGAGPVRDALAVAGLLGYFELVE